MYIEFWVLLRDQVIAPGDGESENELWCRFILDHSFAKLQITFMYVSSKQTKPRNLSAAQSNGL